jgi:O-antigen ligase
MITKENCYDILILLTLVSFTIFGSLSHLFSLGLILLVLFANLTTKKSWEFDAKAIALYFALAGCFLIFALRSIYDDNLLRSLESLSPMLSIPLIGLLFVFHKKTSFKLNANKVSKYSQIAVFSALFVYTILLIFVGPNSIFFKHISGRVELFSGNPIPFSYAMLGISIFCLADWRNSNEKNRIVALSLFLIGLIFSGFLSGTRGTLLSIILISPFLLFYLSKRVKLTMVISAMLVIFGLILVQMDIKTLGNSTYIDRIVSGVETLTSSKNKDSSIMQRKLMWSAAGKAISEKPLSGYGVTERFTSIEQYLPNSFQNRYSHPHNDILASTISVGLLGSFAAFISLISVFLASLLTFQRSGEKVFFSIIILIPTLFTANISTVFFNDISAAWMAFSTYLIWIVDFGENKT